MSVIAVVIETADDDKEDAVRAVARDLTVIGYKVVNYSLKEVVYVDAQLEAIKA